MQSRILLLLIFLVFSFSLSAQHEYLFTDTIPFSKPVKTRSLSVRQYEKYISSKKLNVLYKLQDTSATLVLHSLDTLSRYAILVRHKNKLFMYDVLAGKNNLADTSYVELNGKAGKEICLRWTIYESRDHEFGVYSGTRSGMEIWEIASGTKLLDMETSSCGQGWNMCTGKSHSGCGLNIKTEFRNDSVFFQDITGFENTKKIIVYEREEDSYEAYEKEVSVFHETITSYMYIYSSAGLIRKSKSVKHYSTE